MHGFADIFRTAACTLCLALPLGVAVLGQSNCSTPCPNPQWLPISGTVVDAQDGRPVAGATVTLRDWGNNTMDSSLHLYNLGALRSKITTGQLGSFSFPVLWNGQYVVRASAPGYLGAVEVQFARTANDGLSPRAGALFGGSPAGDLRLSRNSLHVFSMSVTALEAFGPPRVNVWWEMRQYIAAGFSSDGKRIGFVTLDKDRLPSETNAPVPHCRAWTYLIDSGELRVAELPAARTGEETFCSSGENLVWFDKAYYISTVPSAVSQKQFSTESVRGTVAVGIPDISGLPDFVRSQLTRSRAALTEDTNDGRFSLEESPELGCTEITITSTGSSQPITTDCAASYLLDRDRDLLYMIVGGKSGEKENWFGALMELNLATGNQRHFRLPGFDLKPQLLALQARADGTSQLAYTMEGASRYPGECDQPASDYYPWPMLLQVGDFRRHADGSMPHLFSVCFATIPPNP